ncbi:MAG TPA: isocitrate lyase/phosphoenolpyruvate mutase family protein [Myxococcales bacterium]|nr:isocitrate lyase/phosphoenolpyruvate mutase family protein [Myxococcales bacterium]HET9754845.1 isocitrate lyase/phosphoenolpyruvate mutase family protein [Myxococcales bacterium]
MDTTQLRERAALLRRLHDRSRILLLPNAWDVASARVVEQAGFPAVATSSAGIAAVLGYADGERISRDEMLEMVARIARAVRVPVTADLEAGYGDVAGTVAAALRAGAVGMNLEDSTSEDALVDVAAQVESLKAARAAADRAGIPFVINARTDVYLLGIGEKQDRLAHSLERARAYLAAGADCIFVPGVRDAETIGKLVKGIDGPLNVLAGPGCPEVATLSALGVARVSAGSGTMRAALTAGLRAAEEMRDRGTYGFTEGILTHAQVNALLSRAK